MASVPEPRAATPTSLKGWFAGVASTMLNRPSTADAPTAAADTGPAPDAAATPSPSSEPPPLPSPGQAAASKDTAVSMKDAAARTGAQAWGALKNVWKAGQALTRNASAPSADVEAGGVGSGAAVGSGPAASAATGPNPGAPGDAGVGAAAPLASDVAAGESAGLLGAGGVPSALSGRLNLLKGMMSSGVGKLKQAVGRGDAKAADGSTAPPPAANDDGYCGLSRVQRIQGFVLLLFTGVVLLSIAIFVFLPVAILMPSKFALSFTMGSVCIMGAFAAFNGPKNFVKSLMARERLGFTAAYLFSIGFTLYAALFVGSYLLVIVAAVGQIAALLWYTATFFPYGRAGMKLLTRFCGTALRRVCWPCMKGVTRLCSRG